MRICSPQPRISACRPPSGWSGCLVGLVVLHLLPVLSPSQAHVKQEPSFNITQILNSIFEKGYDKRVRPNYGGDPVEVGVTMHILSISQVSEVQMDFTLDFYFRQSWSDPRLSFTVRQGFESLTVGAEVAERIWVPDTFFANEKSAYFHQATTPNTFLRIRSKGEVFRSMRLTVTASCPMDLRYFPMDRQACPIEIESFGYTMQDIQYYWMDGKKSVGMSNDVELPQFKVANLSNSWRVVYLTTGNYSRLACKIQFVRSMGYYLIQIYIPAGLIVIISWVSFWLHRNATPARVALGVTTVLTMTTLMSSTNAAMPKISYIKSIDIYLGTCFVMVFASLLEYATVGYLGKRIAMRKTRTQLMAKLAEQQRQRCAAALAQAAEDTVLIPCHAAEVPLVKTAEVRLKMYDHRCYNKTTSSSTMNSVGHSHLGVFPQANGGNPGGGPPPPPPPHPHHRVDFDVPPFLRNTNKMFGVSPSDIDKYSRVVFPVCFVCFNLMYWAIYLHISETAEEETIITST